MIQRLTSVCLVLVLGLTIVGCAAKGPTDQGQQVSDQDKRVQGTTIGAPDEREEKGPQEMNASISEPQVPSSSQDDLAKYDYGDTFYTQVNVWVESSSFGVEIRGDTSPPDRYVPPQNRDKKDSKKGRKYVDGYTFGTANYELPRQIPINTKVTMYSVQPGDVVFQVPSMDNVFVWLENTREYSGVSTDKLIKRLFSKQKVELGGMSAEIRQAIIEGDIRKGMTKDQVLMARGYPPAHATPNYDKPYQDTWKYWEDSGSTFEVEFDGGEVVKISSED